MTSGTKQDKINQYKLDLANGLVYEAAGCHFLTDSFSAGHLRTPRYELNNECGIKTGSLMAKCMHDEDNLNGLWVTSIAKAIPWKMYGDNSLFTIESGSTPSSDKENWNFRHAVNAVVVSLMELIDHFTLSIIMQLDLPVDRDYQAYVTGLHNSAVKHIPNLFRNPSHINHFPLFRVTNGKIEKRTSALGNIHEHYTTVSLCSYSAVQCAVIAPELHELYDKLFKVGKLFHILEADIEELEADIDL